jgi:hypothetical protein
MKNISQRIPGKQLLWFIIVISSSLFIYFFFSKSPTLVTPKSSNLDSLANRINQLIVELKRYSYMDSNAKTMAYINTVPFQKIKELAANIQSFYGDFDVQTINDINQLPGEARPITRAVCALIPKRLLESVPGGFVLKSPILRDYISPDFGQKICNDCKFINEVIPAFGTGWAFKNDLVITANHCCANEHMLDTLYFVFNFLENTNSFISSDRVFKAISIIPKKNEDLRYDFTIIKVDRPVPNPLINYLERNSDVKTGERLYMLGHPLGLPMKYTPGGIIYECERTKLKTNLDAFSGNSGSPVLNMRTHKIEGILIKGRRDFEWVRDKNCVQYCFYPFDFPDAFDGEEVLRLNNLILKY